MRQHYFAQVNWFFSLIILRALCAIVVHREWFHKLIAALSIALFAICIALLFVRLPNA